MFRYGFFDLFSYGAKHARSNIWTHGFARGVQSPCDDLLLFEVGEDVARIVISTGLFSKLKFVPDSNGIPYAISAAELRGRVGTLVGVLHYPPMWKAVEGAGRTA